MQPKIAVLIDSSSDLPQSVLTSHANIAVVPAVITFDDEEFLDRVTMTPAAFYARLRQTDRLPKTASPAPDAARQAIQALVAQGYTHIIGFTVAAVLSATYQSFQLAAQQFPEVTIEIFDTKSVGIGSGLQAAYAVSLIDGDTPWPALLHRVSQSILHSHVYFYIPTLKYLRAGGRIGKVAGLVGNALKLKPVIACDPEGTYYPVAKSRSETKALAKMIALATADLSPTATLAVAYGDNRPQAEALATQIQAQIGRPVNFIGDISPAPGVHVGPDLLGVAVQTLD